MATRNLDLEFTATQNVVNAVLQATEAGYLIQSIRYDDYHPDLGVQMLARKGRKADLVRLSITKNRLGSVIEVHKLAVPKRPAQPAAQPAPASGQPLGANMSDTALDAPAKGDTLHGKAPAMPTQAH